MSDYVKQVAGFGDQYLTALAETQENFLKSIATFSEWAPKTPAMPAPAFAADLPTAKEITEANFAFASKLIKQQKAFADKLFAKETSAK